MTSVSHLVVATLTGVAVTVAASERIDFSTHDINGDGYLSQGEWQDANATADFRALDRNRDGRLDREELRANEAVTMSEASASSSPSATRDGGQRNAGGDGFTSSDTNRDRRVSRQEAQDARFDDIVVYFDTLDTNRDSLLDENEWAAGERAGIRQDMDDVPRLERSSYAGERGRVQFRDDFEMYDANGDGHLDEGEATEDWVDVNLFERSDVNDDGLIDFGEAEDGFMERDDDENARDEDY